MAITTIIQERQQLVGFALSEDIGSGDITAELVPADQTAKAKIITREDCIVAGQAWVDEVFNQLGQANGVHIDICWHLQDGEAAEASQIIAELEGNTRTLLTGERGALNFMQLLSGTATRCAYYADLVKHTQVKLLDTRKTIPGLRSAQKYAVTCGGCYNHRIGLYDAFLIKENHIIACGGISQAIKTAKHRHPNKPVEIEVENIEEFKTALDAHADIVMLDNFSLETLRLGVEIKQAHRGSQVKLEASGGITDDNLVAIAETGVDYISIGGLTKDVIAVDLSMRFGEA